MMFFHMNEHISDQQSISLRCDSDIKGNVFLFVENIIIDQTLENLRDIFITEEAATLTLQPC